MSSANVKDYFSTFLAAAADGPSPTAPGAEAAPAQPAEAGVEKILLTFLAAQPAPVSVKEILARLEIPPSIAITTLHRLAEAKLVELQHTPSDEHALITELGRRVGG